MNAKVIKPAKAELLDEEMRLMACAVSYGEFGTFINSACNPKAVFDAWQLFCGRMYLQECGRNPARN
ncbi:MAG TPA: hypothetical protein VGY98_00750 [Verrucomicrobiae bacterium]|nr:hypothetical protein [Verrucomicrobiae bacterium]